MERVLTSNAKRIPVEVRGERLPTRVMTSDDTSAVVEHFSTLHCATILKCVCKRVGYYPVCSLLPFFGTRCTVQNGDEYNASWWLLLPCFILRFVLTVHVIFGLE